MTPAPRRGLTGYASSDREHLQLLLARLAAATHALAEDVAASLEVSDQTALALARLRIDEVIGGRDDRYVDLLRANRNDSLCGRCRALLVPDTGGRADRDVELFEACMYCGQAANSDAEWKDEV